MNIVISVLFILFFSVLYALEYNRRKRNDAFKNYAEVSAIFETAKAKAYSKIFMSDILVQTSSGFKIDTKESERFQKEYISLTFSHCGPKIIDDLLRIHGNLDSICLQLASELMINIRKDEAAYNVTIQENEPFMNRLLGHE
jgi:hypothetical protein